MPQVFSAGASGFLPFLPERVDWRAGRARTPMRAGTHRSDGTVSWVWGADLRTVRTQVIGEPLNITPAHTCLMARFTSRLKGDATAGGVAGVVSILAPGVLPGVLPHAVAGWGLGSPTGKYLAGYGIGQMAGGMVGPVFGGEGGGASNGGFL